jgi:hypothetical protein
MTINNIDSFECDPISHMIALLIAT